MQKVGARTQSLEAALSPEAHEPLIEDNDERENGDTGDSFDGGHGIA
jgi:hypothetical protein